MSISQRTKLIFFASVLCVVLGTTGIFLLRDSAPESASVVAVESIPDDEPTDRSLSIDGKEKRHLLVKEVHGAAERKQPGSMRWLQVQAGDELFADDQLRTNTNAAVRLAVDEHSRFELAGRSELSVRELTETVHKLELALGQISVDYDESHERLLKIVASDNENAVAETRSAQFVVQRVGDEVTVATHMGRVKLTAKKETVNVEAGSYSRVRGGSAPIKPEPIPMEVLLKVAAPKRAASGTRSAVISGKTDVGAAVFLNNAPTPVDEKGGFRASVPLHPGRTQVNVVSRTAWGKAEEKLSVQVVPNSGEVTDATVKWGKSASSKKKRKTKKGTN